jgi:cysteine synthase A
VYIGPRFLNVLRDIEFPWKEAHDVVEEVGSFEAYEKRSVWNRESSAAFLTLFCSMELSRMGILAGPSSGLTLVGLFNFLTKRKAGGTLDEFRNAGGEIPCQSSGPHLCTVSH